MHGFSDHSLFNQVHISKLNTFFSSKRNQSKQPKMKKMIFF